MNPAPRWSAAQGVAATLGVGTGGTAPLSPPLVPDRLRRFDWATDRPEVALAHLEQEEVLQAWIRLLTAPGCDAVAVSLGPPGAVCSVLDAGLDADGVAALSKGLHAVTRAADAAKAPE